MGRFTGIGLPDGLDPRADGCLGILAGIGFTMSLFIADLASLDAAGHRDAKLGILAASVVAGVGGWIAMRLATRVRHPTCAGREPRARIPDAVAVASVQRGPDTPTWCQRRRSGTV